MKVPLLDLKEQYKTIKKEILETAEELFESQISVITQELGLEQVFSRNLRQRMDLFKSHVALYRRKAGNVSQQEIQSDLIGP